MRGKGERGRDGGGNSYYCIMAWQPAGFHKPEDCFFLSLMGSFFRLGPDGQRFSDASLLIHPTPQEHSCLWLGSFTMLPF